MRSLIFVLLLLVATCGQKGDLKLPNESATPRAGVNHAVEPSVPNR